MSDIFLSGSMKDLSEQKVGYVVNTVVAIFGKSVVRKNNLEVVAPVYQA